MKIFLSKWYLFLGDLLKNVNVKTFYNLINLCLKAKNKHDLYTYLNIYRRFLKQHIKK